MDYAKCSKCGDQVIGIFGKWSKHWRCMELSEKRVNKKTGTITTSIDELAENYDDMMKGEIRAKGFTIGNGSKLYWYITPNAESGKYRCLPIEENGYLGNPVYHYPEKKITIHY